jgi:hypothetical protein
MLCPRTSFPPVTAVVRMARSGELRSSTGRRWKPCSGIRKMQAIPVSTETIPPKTIPAPRCHIAIPTPRAEPAIAPRYENWFPRRNTRPIPSTPCSSVIHASQAPLMNVPPIPRRTTASTITQ